MESSILKFKIIIEGMHCSSCELWLEDTISKIPGIISVDANSSSNMVSIELEQGENLDFILTEINSKINSRNYFASKVSDTNQVDSENSVNLGIETWINPVLFSTIILSIFFVVQNIDFLGTNSDSTNYFVIFIIGLVASISACGSTVGSLVLGLSASSKNDYDLKNDKIVYGFHVSRIVTFFILGGLLGLIGSSFLLNSSIENLLRIIVQIILLILGLNLLGFHSIEKIIPRLPKFLSKNTFTVSRAGKWFTPIILGILTFFLPCGFTQSMQLQALKSGSLIKGSMIMGIFVLGTLPMMLGITKISDRLSNQNTKLIFFRTAGIIVTVLAIWQIWLLYKVVFGY